MMDSASLPTVLQPQQPQSQIPSKVYANYAMGPPQVSFYFTFEPPNYFLHPVLVFAFCFLSHLHVAAMFTNEVSSVGVCNTAILQSYLC